MKDSTERDLLKIWLYMAWRHVPAFIRISEIEQQRKYARADQWSY